MRKAAKKIRIALVGANGRMGKEILCLAVEDKSIKIIEKLNPKLVDVVIDFSSPEGFSEALTWCVKHKKPLVSGTTGLSQKQFQDMEKASKKMAVLWSSNMSMGIAALTDMLSSLRALKSYDFQIEEHHHSGKKDKPSGTAISLQKALEKSVNKKIKEPISIREGEIFGIHKIHIKGPEETLTLEHVALDRRLFARGALLSAKFIHKKSKGLFSIRDLL